MKDLTERQREVLTFISNYVKEHTYPPTIREIAEKFAMSVKGAHDHVTALKKKGRLRGEDKRSRTMEVVKEEGDEGQADFVDVPVLGLIAAGNGMMAEEAPDGSVRIPRSELKRGSEYFALKVRGDSMIGAGILDGDTAIIEQRNFADNGDIVVAQVNDETRTIKRYFREKTRIRLQPENDNYKPIYSRDVLILGRLAKITRSY
jgi:repressor LexA